MAPIAFTHRLRVTYAECTIGNHVYYSRYLDYLEEGRGEFFRQLGFSLQQLYDSGTLFPVLEVRVRYKGAARYDDVLRLELCLTEAHRVKITFAYKLWSQNQRLLLEGETIHVCTNREEKPQRLPQDLLTALQPYLHPLPQSGNT